MNTPSLRLKFSEGPEIWAVEPAEEGENLWKTCISAATRAAEIGAVDDNVLGAQDVEYQQYCSCIRMRYCKKVGTLRTTTEI